MNDKSCSNNATKSKYKIPLSIFFKDARLVFKFDSLAKEILGIAFPSALAIAADPIASLIETAFIGHLGPVQLAAAGVAIALFNQASKVTIFPLVSITTSFVAEEDTLEKNNTTAMEKKPIENIMDKSKDVALPQDIEEYASEEKNETPTQVLAASVELIEKSTEHETNNGDGTNTSNSNSGRKKRHISSASTALLFGLILGLIQAATLLFAAKPLLRVMGLKSNSPTLIPAEKYLKLRSLGAPPMLLSLAMQGIFRGFKDTTTPLYVIVLGYSVKIALDPVLIYAFKWGLNGAAISHVFSQYMMALVLLLILLTKVVLMPPSIKDLQFSRFLKNGGMLFAKVVAVTFCVTLAASLASRLGSIQMAAFQTCLQVWLTSSLLSDGLAIAVQAILASSFAEKDYDKVVAATTRTLQMTLVLGLGLSLVGSCLYFGAGMFSESGPVVHLIRIAVPFVAATQPINALAFVFDGVNYGASDFAYSAYSMVMVSFATIASLFLLYKSNGFIGIWIALTIYMTLRMFAGLFRMGTCSGPWRFLRGY
ncbi:protein DETOXIFICATION 43-like [Lotus japonicus]|uniref:Protein DETOXIFICATION n=1 Tax=Lotus japonicus TaxID=34305 RepID=S6APG9_LOTJA|nr:protein DETOXIFICATION 43-like [Lotus japonicus]BAN59993.1 multidrug and toxic compound extrusion transporter [Lotus japonicus]